MDVAKCAFYWHLCSTFIICGMEQDQLLLSWDDFEKMTQASFRDLLGETEFTDVTLATDDNKQIVVSMLTAVSLWIGVSELV